MPRKEQGWITFQASQEEMELLEELCKKSQRTKTEVLRELIRGLDGNSLRSRPSKPSKKSHNKNNYSHSFNNLQINHHNIIKGVITQVIRTNVNTLITLKILHEVDLTSVVTTDSADKLDLSEGKEAYAVINSNNIVIAKREISHQDTTQNNETLINSTKKQQTVSRVNSKINNI
ncbi:TOBE domain-containing protein [Aliinostoc sp. HNIBRCY26]|uniref:TOBE domain-containing protein n=1 Tax=Aliinostoc sp. HNIBRCY26 TaxID=3418997 RepID=UPI003CFFB689